MVRHVRTFDALAELAPQLSVSGAILLDETYHVPWAISIPHASELADLTSVPKDRLTAAFHYVQHGSARLMTDTGERFEADKGDLFLCFGGRSHVLSLGDAVNPRPLRNLIGAATPPRVNDSAQSTSLVCGVFGVGSVPAALLRASLPSILLLRSGQSNEMDHLVSLLVNELESSQTTTNFMVARLLEMVCFAALRSEFSSPTATQIGWYPAANNPPILAALNAFHGDPSQTWDVGLLASVSALSPSRFASMFRETLGESPMAYVGRWRMILASELLRSSDQTTAEVARLVGYQSPSSFTRTFTRHFGHSPRDHRQTAANANRHTI